MADRVGQQLDKYRLTRLLGKGGSGDVYLGEHIYLETQAAIKVLNTQVTGDDVEKFLAEARTLARLRHPNIVRVLDSGLEDFAPYLVMDYAPKGTLRDRHSKGSRVPLTDILSYVKQLAAALQYAHNQKLIHRDVKPGNILIGANNEILLSDFGIAVIAHTTNSRSLQDIVGTALYMSPEQLEGKASPASDQYALGVVVYEWLCGGPPFQGSPMELAMRHLTSTPTPPRQLFPDIAPTVEMVVLTALAKDPQWRFASIQAFANALEQACQSSRLTGSLLLDIQQPPGLTGRSLYSATTEPQFPIVPSASEAISNVPTAPLPPGGPQEADVPTFISPSQGMQVPPPPTGIWQRPASSPLEKCPFCLAATRPGDNFCLNCGNRLVAPPPPSEWGASLLGSVIMPTIAPSSEEQKVAEDTFATVADESVFPISSPSVAEPVPTVSSSPTFQSIPAPSVFAPKDVGLSKEQWMEKGDVHYKMEQYTDAFKAYEQVIQIDVQYTHAHFGKGNALQSLGQYEASLAAYDDAVHLGLNNAAVWNAIAEVLHKLRRYKLSLDAYERVLAFTPDDAGIWITKGNILFRKLKLYKEALIAYERVLELNPHNAPIWIVKGEVLYRLEYYELALEAYSHASRVFNRRTSVWTSKGEVLYKLKRYEEALEVYEHARFLKPHDFSIVNKCELLRDLIRHQEELREQEEERLRRAELRWQEEERQRQEALRQQQERLGASRIIQSGQPRNSQKPQPPSELDDEATRVVANDEMPPSQFDVYLIYSKADAAWVENLAERLEDERHIKVWLDKWMAIPGVSEQHTRAQGIHQANCFAVCIGEQTPSEWFKREIQLAQNRREDNKALRVIPVLLPNTKNINVDEFVELNNAVDFRIADQEYAFHRLVSGIKGIAPGRWTPEKTVAPDKTITMVRDILVDLQGLPIDKDVARQMQQTVLEKVWLPNWLMQLKENTYE